MAAKKDNRNLYDRAVGSAVKATRPQNRPKINKPDTFFGGVNPVNAISGFVQNLGRGAQNELLRLAVGLDQNFGSDNSPQEAQRLADLVAELQSRDPGNLTYSIGQGIGQSAAALPLVGAAAAALPASVPAGATAALTALANAGRVGKAVAPIASAAATIGLPAAAVEFLSGQPFADETKRKESRASNALAAGTTAVLADTGIRALGSGAGALADKIGGSERLAKLKAVAEGTKLAKSFGITPRRPQFNPDRTAPLSELSVGQSRQTTQEFAKAAQAEISKIGKPLFVQTGKGKTNPLPSTEKQGERLVRALKTSVERTQKQFGEQFNQFEADIGPETPIALNNFKSALDQFNVPSDSFLSFMKDIPYYQALAARSFDMEGQPLAIPFSEAKQLRGILHGRFKKYFSDNGLPDNEASRNAKMLYRALAQDTEEAVRPILGPRFADYQKLGRDYGDFKQNVEFFKKPIIDQNTGGESFRQFDKVVGSDADRFRAIREYMGSDEERIFKEATSTALYGRGRDGELFDPQRFLEDYSNYSPEMRAALSELSGGKADLDGLSSVYTLFKDTGAFDSPVSTGPSAHHGVTRHRMLARAANARGTGEATNFLRNIPVSDSLSGISRAVQAQQQSPAARTISAFAVNATGNASGQAGSAYGDARSPALQAALAFEDDDQLPQPSQRRAPRSGKSALDLALEAGEQ